MLISPSEHFYSFVQEGYVLYAIILIPIFAIFAIAITKNIFSSKEGRCSFIINPCFGILFFLIAFLPAIGIVFKDASFMTADRYGYFPIIGIALFVALLYEKIITDKPEKIKILVISLFSLWLMITATFAQLALSSWQNGLALWKSVLYYHPENANVHYHVARAYTYAKKLRESEYHYHKCLKIDPSYYQSWINLGGLYCAAGYYTDALSAYNRALQAGNIPERNNIIANIAEVKRLQKKGKEVNH